jgi:hypothetical protein
MAMLAERVDGARRRRHPPRAPWPPRRSPGRWRARPDHHPRRCGRLPAVARLCPRPGAWPPRVGSGRRGQLRRRPGGVPAAARRTRRGVGRPKRPARRTGANSDAWTRSAPAREALGQERLARCAASRPAGSAAGAACHPALRHPGQGGRHRGAQSADRGRPGGAARRAARGQHRHPNPALRQLRARPARSLRAPADRARAADHRRSASSSWPPRPTSSPCERTTLIGAVAPWLLEVPGVGPGERRPSPGQLVASRPVALARPPSRPWPGSTRSPPPPGR